MCGQENRKSNKEAMNIAQKVITINLLLYGDMIYSFDFLFFTYITYKVFLFSIFLIFEFYWHKRAQSVHSTQLK